MHHMTVRVERRPSSTRRARTVVVLFSGLLAAATVVIPVSAASPQRQGMRFGGGSAVQRTVTRTLIPSERAAAKAAAEHPRVSTLSRARPLLKVNISHPPMPGAFPTTGTRAPNAIRPRIVTAPDVAVASRFGGLSQAESGDFYPPDPWVGVNAGYVVQSVNSTVRVTNRLGTELMSIPVWALFALTPDQNPSDPRVIWDAPHGRWVADAISYNFDFSMSYLNLAVSETADPTGAWDVYAVHYLNEFPDFPSIASSTDKIVIADDLYISTGTFLGGDLNTFTWSSLLAGGPVAHNECIDSTWAHPRAAQVLSPGSDVHLIMEATSDADQWYFRLTGAGACTTSIGNGADISTSLAYPAFTLPPDPRQSPGDPLTTAIDERPTDAIFQNGSLWWVSTVPVSYDSGATFNDAVALWNINVDPTTHVLTAGNSQTISGGDGIDSFMGGIGLSGDGTLFSVYSQSSNTDLISMWANRVQPGGVLGTPVQVDLSDASTTVDRWGDFAGVAIDPTGTGAVWATHEIVAGNGSWRTDVVRLIVDAESPAAPASVSVATVTPETLTAGVSVRLAWPAASDVSSGAVTYQIAQNIDGVGFDLPSNVTGTSTVRPVLIGHTYQFEVRSVDAVGHVSGWRGGPTFRPTVYQQTSNTVYSGTWSSTSNSVYSGGSIRYASIAGRAATFTATGARSIAIVTTKGRTRGSFKVYVDGIYRGTISTYSTTTRYRQLVYQFGWAAAGTHKIKIVVSGTLHHARVDVDAFVVLR
jgi:hypothetical protein